MTAGQTHTRILTSLSLSATTPLVYLTFMLHLEKKLGLCSPLSTLAAGINLLAWHERLSPSVRLNVNLRNAETPLVMSALLEHANST